MRFSQGAVKAIADFKGVRYRPSRGKLRPTQDVDGLMEVLLERYQIEGVKPEQAIMEKWRDVVGPQFAHRCSPVRLTSDGVLFIATSNASMRSELQFQKRVILSRIQKIPECSDVREIRLGSG